MGIKIYGQGLPTKNTIIDDSTLFVLRKETLRFCNFQNYLHELKPHLNDN